VNGTQLYDWSRLVAKVKLAAPLLQAIADKEEHRVLFRYNLRRYVAKLKRLEENNEATNGQS
jgi:hypothetical protein